MEGIVAWALAGAAAGVVARFVTARRRGVVLEVGVGAAVAVAAGLVATALDFGGTAVVDWRAVTLAFVVAAAGVGMVRLVPRG